MYGNTKRGHCGLEALRATLKKKTQNTMSEKQRQMQSWKKSWYKVRTVQDYENMQPVHIKGEEEGTLRLGRAPHLKHMSLEALLTLTSVCQGFNPSTGCTLCPVHVWGHRSIPETPFHLTAEHVPASLHQGKAAFKGGRLCSTQGPLSGLCTWFNSLLS